MPEVFSRSGRQNWAAKPWRLLGTVEREDLWHPGHIRSRQRLISRRYTPLCNFIINTFPVQLIKHCWSYLWNILRASAWRLASQTWKCKLADFLKSPRSKSLCRLIQNSIDRFHHPSSGYETHGDTVRLTFDQILGPFQQFPHRVRIISNKTKAIYVNTNV